MGRDLAYSEDQAELLVVGSAPEVYRLSLTEGRFMTPLPCGSEAVNACGRPGVHVQGLGCRAWLCMTVQDSAWQYVAVHST